MEAEYNCDRHFLTASVVKEANYPGFNSFLKNSTEGHVLKSVPYWNGALSFQ